jgi:hypothetical protein
MPDQQQASKIITLTKAFLMTTHAHPRLAPLKDIDKENEHYNRMWENSQDENKVLFGGAYGNQFSSIEELKAFDMAFNSIMVKHGIDAKHKDPLLYFISFLGEEFERQSLNNNQANRLLDYTKFILDLHRNCASHFEAMEKNKDYEMIYDQACKEYLFARKELIEKLGVDVIAEDRPQMNPGDIVSYIRVDIFEMELYVPYDLLFSITSDRRLRDFNGSVVPSIKLPAYLQSELFKFAFKYMLDEHKYNNTPFYQDIKKPGLIPRDFKKLYHKYGKHAISQTESLIRVALVISDYLMDQQQIKTKRAIAAFLFDYFSLFKVIQLKKAVNPPDNYNELAQFYNKHGVTSETIRLMMKDVQ